MKRWRIRQVLFTVRNSMVAVAVMAVVVLFTLFSPTRQILFFFFIPGPSWVLCAIYLATDLFAFLTQR